MVFGRKKKQEVSQSDLDKTTKRLEVLNKSIDVNKLASEIAKFLTKSDDPFDYCTYTYHELAEKKLRVFKIEYGFKSPTTKFLVVIEGDSNQLQILDHLPPNYADYAATLLVSFAVFLPSIINARVFYNKLWAFIEDNVTALSH
jgi:hypothetical protein